MPARAGGIGLSVEGGLGLSFQRGSGGAGFDFLGQPFTVDDSNLLGAGGRAYSLGAWAHLPARPDWALGLEYLALNGDGAIVGTAPDGVDILADPTTSDTRLRARRRQAFLSLGWRPYITAHGRALAAFGLGFGDGHVTVENRLQSAFLGTLQDQSRHDLDPLSVKIALGYEHHVARRVTLGARGHYIRDLGDGWPGGRTGAMAFLVTGGLSFGGGGQQAQAPTAGRMPLNGSGISLGVERVQGAYNVKITATARSPLGAEQRLDFRTRDAFNGQSTLLSLAWWGRAPGLCGAEDCAWQIGAEPFYQRGRAGLDAVIAAEGPLVGRDNRLAARARVDAVGAFLNLAYRPASDGGRWQPRIAAGLGAAYIDADLVNDDPAGDVFTRTGGTDVALVPQLAVSLDYRAGKGWLMGANTRFMARQMAFGLALGRRF